MNHATQFINVCAHQIMGIFNIIQCLKKHALNVALEMTAAINVWYKVKCIFHTYYLPHVYVWNA